MCKQACRALSTLDEWLTIKYTYAGTPRFQIELPPPPGYKGRVYIDLYDYGERGSKEYSMALLAASSAHEFMHNRAAGIFKVVPGTPSVGPCGVFCLYPGAILQLLLNSDFGAEGCLHFRHLNGWR